MIVTVEFFPFSFVFGRPKAHASYRFCSDELRMKYDKSFKAMILETESGDSFLSIVRIVY